MPMTVGRNADVCMLAESLNTCHGLKFGSTAKLSGTAGLRCTGVRDAFHVSTCSFRHTPSVHSVIDPHGFILPRPNPPSFRRLIGCAR